jgi:hypothetical protein
MVLRIFDVNELLGITNDVLFPRNEKYTLSVCALCSKGIEIRLCNGTAVTRPNTGGPQACIHFSKTP